MLLSFPYMHQELVGNEVPDLRFFDPGYQGGNCKRWFSS